MSETLLSVGIDIGTTTTQLVLARLTLENRAGAFSVPRVAITAREILYRSAIHFTPLRSDTVIDAEGVREIVAEEYRRAGVKPETVDTGAVIITGETARKENAREVLSALSAFAGDFVVTAAGPDLESVLAARGAGIDEYAEKSGKRILHFDIGGGTSNLALCGPGGVLRTGCLDVGGRLVKVDGAGRITYLSPVIRRWISGGPGWEEGCARALEAEARVTPEQLAPLLRAMTAALEQAAGVRRGRDALDFFRTEGTAWTPEAAPCVSFSGGVGECVYGGGGAEPFAYGDIGVLLARHIRASEFFARCERVRGAERIRATVVGAGSHATELSGSTVYYREVAFPLKNLPVISLTSEEEAMDAGGLARAVEAKLRRFAGGDGLSQMALALRGEKSPGYRRVEELTEGILRGLAPMTAAGFFPVVAAQADMAKALGQAMARRIAGPILCLDGIHTGEGDYIDVGAPAAGGAVLPVVVKTLVFHREG